MDFWNTIAVPNPEFAKARRILLADISGKSVEEVQQSYLEVKRQSDLLAECSSHTAESSIDVTRRLLSRIKPNYALHEVVELHSKLQNLFFFYAPKIVLASYEVSSCSWNITSNTNFICGESIRRLLHSHGLYPKFCLFSDELHIAKPSRQMFGMIEAKTLRTMNIVHIGDHEIQDVAGAKAAGFRTIHLKDQLTLNEIIREELCSA